MATIVDQAPAHPFSTLDKTGGSGNMMAISAAASAFVNFKNGVPMSNAPLGVNPFVFPSAPTLNGISFSTVLSPLSASHNSSESSDNSAFAALPTEAPTSSAFAQPGGLPTTTSNMSKGAPQQVFLNVSSSFTPSRPTMATSGSMYPYFSYPYASFPSPLYQLYPQNSPVSVSGVSASASTTNPSSAMSFMPQTQFGYYVRSPSDMKSIQAQPALGGMPPMSYHSFPSILPATPVTQLVPKDGPTPALTPRGAALPSSNSKSFAVPSKPTANLSDDDSEDDDDDKGEKLVCSFPGCKKILRSRFNLKRHLKKHEGGQPFLCTVCPRRFATVDTLNKHAVTHANKKPYLCRWEGCGQSFADVSNVKRHEMSHLGLKPFRCPVDDCGGAFTRRSSLKSHLLTRHNMKREDPEFSKALHRKIKTEDLAHSASSMLNLKLPLRR